MARVQVRVFLIDLIAKTAQIQYQENPIQHLCSGIIQFCSPTKIARWERANAAAVTRKHNPLLWFQAKIPQSIRAKGSRLPAMIRVEPIRMIPRELHESPSKMVIPPAVALLPKRQFDDAIPLVARVRQVASAVSPASIAVMTPSILQDYLS